MRLLHLSDLHLGKYIGNYSLIEDQKYALDQILNIIDEKNIDVVMIAGDIFDTTIASVDALKLYSDFIDEIIFKREKPVLAISGNHDSAKRLDINSKFFTEKNYHLFGEYKDEVITLEDEYEKINFHLIPYISLNQAKLLFDEDIENFTDLYKNLLKDKSYEDRNVLITHCYANNIGIEDEDAYNEGQKPLIIGGSDAMDGHLFLDFDYVALGHLHGKHYVIDPKIRYSGTFMKYSFDEAKASKSVTIVDITDKVETFDVEIKPLRDFRIIEGYFADIIKMDASDDYIKFILEDDHTIDNAMGKLKEKFPHAVQITYKNSGIFNATSDLNLDLTNKDSLELFKEFYKYKMDVEISTDELELIGRIIEWSL